ncbi:MAG: DUF6356 family protein [Novosphingobium sp.]|uniref:DUF6356 family protein n=1 Tax=Novosphingobium sp. TaxID=1874826 RepID=UPI003C798E44
MALNRLFTEHPASVGESYGEHLLVAGSFGLRMILGGFACLIHAVLPFLFVRTGSVQISTLHETMVTKRRRQPLPAILDFVI